MTLQELERCVDFQKVGYGTWMVYRILSHGRYCVGISHDSLAVDRLISSF